MFNIGNNAILMLLTTLPHCFRQCCHIYHISLKIADMEQNKWQCCFLIASFTFFKKWTVSGRIHTHTHTHTPFYGSMDFVGDNLGEPVPEETFTHSHLSWSSIVPICFIHLLRSMVSSLFNSRTRQTFPQSLSKFSLVYLLAWHPPLHTFLHPISVFFLQHMPIPSQPVLLYYWDYII